MSSVTRYSSLNNNQLQMIHVICDRFEEAMRQNGRPLIERFLVEVPPKIQPQLFCELLEIELETKMSGKQSPNEMDYLDRFPEHRALIATVFTQIRKSNQELVPKKIGRYRIDSRLGWGGFGTVFLGFDDQLKRSVAIKVPRQHLGSSRREIKKYLDEAQTVANLVHPHIVPVHDVGHSDEFPCYIVSRYVEGVDLSKFLTRTRLSWRRSTAIVADIANALHHAHMNGIVHRDVKPGNILLDDNHVAFLTDFGLATKESAPTDPRQFVGTPAYMSPEQSSGEGHRIDGRSDVFSLGAVYYEMLTDHRAFPSKTNFDIVNEIARSAPTPPRQIDEAIPKELERICLKALAIRARERYSTALELEEELRCFLNQSDSTSPNSSVFPSRSGITHEPNSETPSDASPALPIIPHGLKSFSEDDSDSFIELLAGPRDRFGLPESIRFWQKRIEHTDMERTFRVGVLYGPSGCGKSSLMKAGIIPRLSDKITTVFIESAAGQTEHRLLLKLQRKFPDISTDLNLKEMLTALRLGQDSVSGNKILIIIDQFEQWLHSENRDQNSELVAALRQCDGSKLQTILLVRDDFWLGISRLMSDLEIDLVAGTNLALMDLFDATHARKVLIAFGKAYGRLPDRASNFTEEQNQFLDRAINELADNGKVICVRVALFAEMMKNKPWIPDSLKNVDGMRGIGTAFLEATFNATTHPVYRLHQRAARRVLASLLPTSNVDIKGQLRSYDQLRETAEYSSQPRDFETLIRILDTELHLISPSESETPSIEGDRSPDSRNYQLTHDYLVHSLREWLTQKQKETRRGRAELLLEERSELWNSKPKNHHLPSAFDWLSITAFTTGKKRTPNQAHMMKRAGWFHGVRWSLGLMSLAILAIIIQQIVASSHQRSLLLQAKTSIDAVVNSGGQTVPRAIADLEAYPTEMVLNELHARISDPEKRPSLALKYSMAHFGFVDVPFLVSRIEDLPAVEVENTVVALSHSRAESLSTLHTIVESLDELDHRELIHRLAIVALYLGDNSLARKTCRRNPNPSQFYDFVRRMSTWRGNDSHLPEIASTISDPGLRFALCLAIGSTPPEQLTKNSKLHCQPFLTAWFQDDGDSGVHSAAGWALGKLKIHPPVLESGPPVKSKSWHVNSIGMTMLELPSASFDRIGKKHGQVSNLNSKKQTVVLTKPFCISDREISNGLFKRFIHETESDGVHKPSYVWRGLDAQYSDDYPAPMVDWQSAALFCNWLSEREGLQACYKKTGVTWNLPIAGDIAALEFDAQADGYRLPTEAEWEFANRAGTSTKYFFGDNPIHAQQFANISSVDLIRCANLLPNRFGIFDMQGNVEEWCHNWYQTNEETERTVTDPMGPPSNPNLLKTIRGGDFRRGVLSIETGTSGGRPLSGRNVFDGFRIVRPLESF